MRTSTAVLAAALSVPSPARADDWYIGLSNPSEIVTLTTDKAVTGNVYLFNNARLNLRAGATLSVGHELGVFNNATFDAQNSTIHFPQSYAYQCQFTTADSAQLLLTDSGIDGNGRSFGVGLTGTSHAEFQRVTVVNGFATWALFNQASAQITSGVNTGEFVPFGNVSLNITGSQGVLLWLTLFSGSTVDVTLPPPGPVPSFTIGPAVPWATNVPYSATLTDCTDVNWSVMARSGSSGTFRDSTLRVVGSYFEGSDAVSIKGVANSTAFTDTSFTWGSVHHRFINTSVRTWNYYAAGTSNVTLESCVAGEIWAADHAFLTMAGSLCDGSGGYINVDGNGVLYMFSSTNLSQTTVGGQGFLVGGNSAFIGPDFDVKGSGLVALVNSQTWTTPRTHDAGTVIDAAVKSLDASVGDLATVRGTARLLKGPQSLVVFDHAALDFALLSNPSAWTPIGGPITSQVQDNTLGTWNTRPLDPGAYALRVQIYSNLGDPVAAIIDGTLAPGCPADMNRDGYVDGIDYDLFNADFESYDPDQQIRADFNGDGFVDGIDYDLFNAAFETLC